MATISTENPYGVTINNDPAISYGTPTYSQESPDDSLTDFNSWWNESEWSYDTWNGPTFIPYDPIWRKRYQAMKDYKGFKGTYEQFMEGVKSYADQLATKYQNNYNNAKNTSSREIAAGYNPNFQGGTSGQQAGESAHSAIQGYDPNKSLTNTLDTLSTIGSIVHPAVGSMIDLMSNIAGIEKTRAEAKYIKDSSPARLEGLKLANQGATLGNSGMSIQNDFYRNINPIKLKEMGLNTQFLEDSYNKRLKFLDERNVSAFLDNNSKLFQLFGWDKPEAFSKYFSPSEDSPDSFDYILKKGSIALQETAKNKAEQIVEGIKLNNNAMRLRQDIMKLDKEQKDVFNDYYKNSIIPSMSSKNLYNKRYYDELYNKVPDIIKNKINKGTIENLVHTIDGYQKYSDFMYGEYPGKIMGAYHSKEMGENPYLHYDFLKQLDSFLME